MKTFKYKFSTLQTALIALGLALCTAGFTVNLVFCLKDGIKNSANPVYPILQYALMFFVSVALFVLLLSLLLSSAYIIDGKTFKTRFGIIVSKYDTQKISDMTLDRKSRKLTLTFESGEFMAVVVKQDWYDDFIEAMLAANPKIEYSIVSLDTTNPDDDKKA